MVEVKHLEAEAPSMQVPETRTIEDRGDAPTATPEEIVADVLMRQTVTPTQVPPSEVTSDIEAEGIAAWHNGKKITALWCNSSPRNAYISVPGMGWKKLSNADDSSFVGMTMMASHAEQTNATVNIRIEADGTVHEIYVW